MDRFDSVRNNWKEAESIIRNSNLEVRTDKITYFSGVKRKEFTQAIGKDNGNRFTPYIIFNRGIEITSDEESGYVDKQNYARMLDEYYGKVWDAYDRRLSEECTRLKLSDEETDFILDRDYSIIYYSLFELTAPNYEVLELFVKYIPKLVEDLGRYDYGVVAVLVDNNMLAECKEVFTDNNWILHYVNKKYSLALFELQSVEEMLECGI